MPNGNRRGSTIDHGASRFIECHWFRAGVISLDARNLRITAGATTGVVALGAAAYKTTAGHHRATGGWRSVVSLGLALAWRRRCPADRCRRVLRSSTGFLGVVITHRWWLLGAGFALYRLFDITKPPPIEFVESIGGGLGIVLDDVLAALLAWLVLRGTQAIWLRP